MPTSKPPLRLSNPYKDNPRCVAAARIAEPVHDYFFNHLLPDYGSAQNLISIFFQKLHAHCLPILPPIWDDENESKIAGILANLNFDARRQSDSSTPKPKKKPIARNGEPRRTPRSSPKSPRARGETPAGENNPNE